MVSLCCCLCEHNPLTGGEGGSEVCCGAIGCRDHPVGKEKRTTSVSGTGNRFLHQRLIIDFGPVLMFVTPVCGGSGSVLVV